MDAIDTILSTGQVQTVCERCKNPFEYNVGSNYYDKQRAVRWKRPFCPSCQISVDEENELRLQTEAQQREIERRATYWNTLCPALYRESDRSRLPAALVRAAEGWQYGAHGLGFIGETGIGKTRCMFLLLHRLIHGDGKRVRYVPMAEFSMKIAKLGFEAETYVHELCGADVLLLDDLGKGKLTDAVQGHLFHITENRTANLRPILFTSNAGTAQLASMLSEDRAAPLLRRLGEFCEIIQA